MAIEREEGVLSSDGVLCTYTGAHTGRSPNAKYIVQDSITFDGVDWENNQVMLEPEFEVLLEKFEFYRQLRETFSQDVYAVRDENFQMPVKIITEFAKHSLFARNMFVPAIDSKNFEYEWEVLHFPSILDKPTVVISFEKRKILISGTLYSGEIKKSVFTVLNFNFLKHGLPMHCSVNVDENRENPAIFFGLSGTGKTTLSAESNRILVGDDEHGWSKNGITNFENGCYAKTIKLSEEREPEIWKACHTVGAMLENVVLVGDRPDFDDSKHTENTRASYPCQFIDNADEDGYITSQPKNIIMLTCDAFGVLPAVMKLSPDEAVKQFLLGYTAKVAGTEKGVTEPKATFSSCFGLPFMPRNPKLYGRKLKELIEYSQADCWFVNTGWTGGSYGEGQRIPLEVTRQIISLIHDGALASCVTAIHEPTGFTIPLHSGIGSEYLKPETSWGSRENYDKKLAELLFKFAEQGT